MSTQVFDQYVDRLMESAATGDTQKVSAILKGIPNVNIKNDKGWTALMFAARKGHPGVIQLLLDNGCDVSIVNSNGQTALDIAKFWNHRQVVVLLEELNTGPLGDNKMPAVSSADNYFGRSILDRTGMRRNDTEWLARTKENSNTVFILFYKLQSVVLSKSDQKFPSKTQFLRLKYNAIKDLLKNDLTVIFLGVEKENSSARFDEDGVAWFAVDVSDMSEGDIKVLAPHGEIVPLFPGLMWFDPGEAGIFAQARSLLAWHDRYKFCPTCGSGMSVEEAGYRRDCVNKDCRSHQGVHNTSHPRIDPTVIMAVISPDSQQLLLGQGAKFPGRFYSCLAGFMEPGETIEAACRREVYEEAGIEVGRVDYHSCQPWPMPASLMIGCMAYANTTKIKVDRKELKDARWFSRQEILLLLTGKNQEGIHIPPEQAIAHQLIRTWVNMTSNL